MQSPQYQFSPLTPGHLPWRRAACKTCWSARQGPGWERATGTWVPTGMPRSSPTAAGCASPLTVCWLGSHRAAGRDPFTTARLHLHTGGSGYGLATDGPRTPDTQGAVRSLSFRDKQARREVRGGGQGSPSGLLHLSWPTPEPRSRQPGSQAGPGGPDQRSADCSPLSPRPLPGSRKPPAGRTRGGARPGKFLATGCPLPPAPREPRAGPATGTHLGAATAASWARRCGPWRRCPPGCHCRARGSCWGCSASCWPRAGPSAAPSPAASGGSSRWRWPLPWLLAGSPTPGRQEGGGEVVSPDGIPSPGARASGSLLRPQARLRRGARTVRPAGAAAAKGHRMGASPSPPAVSRRRGSCRRASAGGLAGRAGLGAEPRPVGSGR